MTNTLIWDIKPIQLLKLNTNWLSVISLIVLCTMVFVTATTIAEACDELKAAVVVARIAVEAAGIAAELAAQALILAEASGNEALIWLALEALDLAINIAVAAEEYLMDLEAELFDCLQGSSGGCDSGSCG